MICSFDSSLLSSERLPDSLEAEIDSDIDDSYISSLLSSCMKMSCPVSELIILSSTSLLLNLNGMLSFCIFSKTFSYLGLLNCELLCASISGCVIRLSEFILYYNSINN